jgi:hypothetical protein
VASAHSSPSLELSPVGWHYTPLWIVAAPKAGRPHTARYDESSIAEPHTVSAGRRTCPRRNENNLLPAPNCGSWARRIGAFTGAVGGRISLPLHEGGKVRHAHRRVLHSVDLQLKQQEVLTFARRAIGRPASATAREQVECPTPLGRDLDRYCHWILSIMNVTEPPAAGRLVDQPKPMLAFVSGTPTNGIVNCSQVVLSTWFGSWAE